MFFYQVLVISVVFLTYSLSLLFFFRRFKKDIGFSAIIVMPIAVFSLGYLLRLTENKAFVDLGYFLTDSSYIFIYSLFTSALVIGQIKFWEK
ncbi:MAG: hypothetical protein A2186_00470 [Candidatus Levybacteria bacterium RIFOXYA1_FULL_41_10]|nr:MAG: hypothetical protein UT44_C0040G0006 [Candidatus Levybacteria bacterium GW2011_GWA1_39_32]KKR50923.1 MAG: hypothetical protein UT87_C0010G0025 [Candidatus Levybacteria bacterium GW2011_GWC1_40_19]OGH26609.1 MAG: hypothetical protein A3D82_04045 [Candidatus Levybacteria bacterium RIFCSPHIGHO2_02_FULL_40_29]OGH32752.1 MAG: hypothetical protein A3E70_01005 [Candidatus Levybacteria bacterium RIFCSPHIGHO2_12_FULL_40_44]OGH41925.1 MAG: hypothetical protein A2965_02765 [Candidatus Levybacteria